MIRKTISLSLGGEERVLMFGTLGFFEYVKEATGKDPLEWLNNLGSQEGLTVYLEDTAAVVYAGVNTYQDSKGSPNIELKAVKKWCNAMTSEETTEVFKTAISSFTTDEKPGEETPNQEQAKA